MKKKGAGNGMKKKATGEKGWERMRVERKKNGEGMNGEGMNTSSCRGGAKSEL